MPSLETVLRALSLAGGASQAAAALVDSIKSLFSKEDQATLTEALADIQQENDEGHRRLQEKLAAAARR